MFEEPQEEVQFLSHLLENLSGLHWQSDADVAVSIRGRIVWASDGFQKSFGIRPLAAKEERVGDLLGIIGLDEWVSDVQQRIINTASMLDGADRRVFLSRTYTYASGAKVRAKHLNGTEVEVIITLAPFSVEPIVYYAIFFNKFGEIKKPDDIKLPSSDPWVSRGEFISHLWKTQKAFLIVIALGGILALGIYRSESIVKLFEVQHKNTVPKKTEDGTIIRVDPKTGERVIRFGQQEP
jgi:hypothetical protein